MDSLPLIYESTKETSKTFPHLKPSPSKTIRELLGVDGNNLVFHTILEREVMRLQYGQVTVNIVIKDGVVVLKTLNIVTNKRIRY